MLWWLWPGLSYGTIDRSGFPVAAISADSLGIGKLPGGWMMVKNEISIHTFMHVYAEKYE